MSRVSTLPMSDHRHAGRRIDPVLLAAAALFAALMIGELIVVLHAGPMLDPSVPYYVT